MSFVRSQEVEGGALDEAPLRAFTGDYAARRMKGTHPDFFVGTAVEAAVALR